MPTVKDYLNNYEDQLKNLKNKSYGQNKKHNSVSYFGNNSHFQRTESYLKTRVLQFIFDRTKKEDPLNLNEIYSHAKKYRQNYSIYSQENKRSKESIDAKKKIEETIEKSKLPEELKTKRNYNNEALFFKDSFLHLVCKYYKWRQKARDGRIFIQPKYRYVKGRGYEKTRGFEDDGCLLIYCNHKPRQKRYQTLEDLAGLLQLPPLKLKEHIDKREISKEQTINEKLFFWLKHIKGLKTNCDKAAKEQKNRRGALKLDIQAIYKSIYYATKENPLPENQKKKNKEIERILKKQQPKKDSDFYKLYLLCEKAKNLPLEITKDLYSETKQKKWKEDLHRNTAGAVYFLSQLNNIAFKERSGNAKTCAICSMDNAQRMQVVNSEKTKAQRVPAISTRIIDGAVMKMARIIGSAIANDKWKDIKPELKKNNKIYIPIITESNRFEFEPDLKTLKNKSKDKKDTTSNPFQDKKQRITKDSTGTKDSTDTKDSTGICPYTGDNLSDTQGDIDHIIPRSGGYGVLNDEANLIWVSKKGNREIKKDQFFSLANLNPKYKEKQFGTTQDSEIKNWIIKQIGEGSGEDFKFGKYLNFINLTPDQQKAFRHALFLVDHPLRKKVIQAIDNRTRTLVNGTQRYFAEVLANKLYKMAKKEKKENLLSFDYFGVEAWDNTRGNGVKDLRKELVEHYKTDLKKFDKLDNNSPQDLYSHLLDAQVAFCMVLYEHQKEGSFKLDLEKDNLGLWSRVDRKTGEMLADKANKEPYNEDLFNIVYIPSDSKKYSNNLLERRKPYPKDKNVRHRPIFNDNAVAVHFLKLIEIKTNNAKEYLSGFLNLKSLKDCLKQKDWQKAIKDESQKNLPYAKFVKDTEKQKLLNLYTVGKEPYQFGYKSRWTNTVIKSQKIGNNQFTVKLYHINKSKVSEFLIQNFNTKTNPEKWKDEDCEILKQLENLWYFTKKEKVLKKKSNSNKISFQMPKEDKFKCAGCMNPQLKYAWENLKNKIKINTKDPDEPDMQIIKEYFLKNKQNKHPHQKVRKDFSLPISSQKGFLIKKKNWQGQNIFYFRPASNDFSLTVLHKDIEGNLPEKKDERLSNIYRKHNIFYIEKSTQLKKQLQPICDDLAIDSLIII